MSLIDQDGDEIMDQPFNAERQSNQIMEHLDSLRQQMQHVATAVEGNTQAIHTRLNVSSSFDF